MPISSLPTRCYDFNNSGADATGNGGALTVSAYGAGNVGVAADSSAANDTTANIGIDLAGAAFSFGHFLDFEAGAAENDDFLTLLAIGDTAKTADFSIYSNPDGTYRVALESVAFAADGPVAAAVAISTGVHRLSAVKSGSTVQLYLDGSAIGTAASLSLVNATDNKINLTVFQYTGPLRQLLFSTAAYSAADEVYLFNSGTPIPFASMSAGGGAGARRVGNHGLSIANRVGI